MPDEDRENKGFRLGWDAALAAVHAWHLAQSKQALALSRRSRFPKSLERDAELHAHAAELITTLDPSDA